MITDDSPVDRSTTLRRRKSSYGAALALDLSRIPEGDSRIEHDDSSSISASYAYLSALGENRDHASSVAPGAEGLGALASSASGSGNGGHTVGRAGGRFRPTTPSSRSAGWAGTGTPQALGEGAETPMGSYRSDMVGGGGIEGEVGNGSWLGPGQGSWGGCSTIKRNDGGSGRGRVRGLLGHHDDLERSGRSSTSAGEL